MNEKQVNAAVKRLFEASGIAVDDELHPLTLRDQESVETLKRLGRWLNAQHKKYDMTPNEAFWVLGKAATIAAYSELDLDVDECRKMDRYLQHRAALVAAMMAGLANGDGVTMIALAATLMTMLAEGAARALEIMQSEDEENEGE